MLSNVTLDWLKDQMWFWLILGIVITSFIFYIAKGFIVLIGGTFLGMYMFNKYKTMKNNNSLAN